MFWLAAIAATIAQPDARPVAPPLRQAKASVRVVRASALHFQDIEARTPALLRKTIIRTPNGATREARLIEFE